MHDATWCGFNFADELRSWLLSKGHTWTGEVWVKWCGRNFRCYKRDGYIIAADAVNGAARIL